jgi:hypothetical protein
MKLNKQYIVDEKNQKIAVQIDMPTFEKIEQILEDYALYQSMQQNDDEVLNPDDAKTYYATLQQS